ncbi:MAG: hypothetical protein V4671_18980 [Armatimonadota bacterium]
MIVHQAVYGEDSTHGHGLIRHSRVTSNERVPFEAAARRTDLAGNPPSGTNWSPYLRSFVEGDYYVLSRTSPDEQASRPGMMRTHAIFLPLSEFCSTGRLADAIPLLLKSRSQSLTNQALDALELNPSEAIPLHSWTLDENRYLAFIDALINENVKSPIVWVGQDQFDAAVARLWEFLSPELRRAFTFRISFSPRDVEDMPPPVVCTPEALGSHWPPPYRTIGKNVKAPIVTSSIAYLAGGSEEKALRELQDQLGLVIDDFYSLRDLARIYTNLEEVKNGGGVESLDAALRLISKRLPIPTLGTEIKANLLQQFSQVTQIGGRSEIRALRNFPIEAFHEGNSFLLNTITGWLQHNLNNIENQSASDTAKVFEEAIVADSHWGSVFRLSISNTLRKVDSIIARSLWSLWTASPTLVSLLEQYIPKEGVTEEALVAQCPSRLSASIGEEIVKLARNRYWLKLHACSVVKYMPWRNALEAHLLVDTNEHHSDLVGQLCKSASESEVLAAALTIKDSRLTNIAGKRIAADSLLKADIDVKEKQWREIWLVSIKMGADPFSGIAEPQSVFHTLLNCIVSGEVIEDALLRELIKNPTLANLNEYPSRERLWPLLSEDIRNIMLAATATGWFQQFKADPNSNTPPEGQLRRKIFEKSYIDKWLLAPTSSAALILTFLLRFSDYPSGENLLVEWITTHPQINHVDAAAIGSLIREHRWRSAASRVMDQVHDGSVQWDPAVEECEELLGMIQQFFRAFRKDKRITADDWWNAWVDLAASLYQTGVRDRNIWTRAWGDLSRIDVNRNGRSQWQEALTLLRNGIEGGITVEGLLHQMRHDWDNNKHLDALERAWLKKKVG